MVSVLEPCVTVGRQSDRKSDSAFHTNLRIHSISSVMLWLPAHSFHKHKLPVFALILNYSVLSAKESLFFLLNLAPDLKSDSGVTRKS